MQFICDETAWAPLRRCGIDPAPRSRGGSAVHPGTAGVIEIRTDSITTVDFECATALCARLFQFRLDFFLRPLSRDGQLLDDELLCVIEHFALAKR